MTRSSDSSSLPLKLGTSQNQSRDQRQLRIGGGIVGEGGAILEALLDRLTGVGRDVSARQRSGKSLHGLLWIGCFLGLDQTREIDLGARQPVGRERQREVQSR